MGGFVSTWVRSSCDRRFVRTANRSAPAICAARALCPVRRESVANESYASIREFSFDFESDGDKVVDALARASNGGEPHRGGACLEILGCWMTSPGVVVDLVMRIDNASRAADAVSQRGAALSQDDSVVGELLFRAESALDKCRRVCVPAMYGEFWVHRYGRVSHTSARSARTVSLKIPGSSSAESHLLGIGVGPSVRLPGARISRTLEVTTSTSCP